MKGRIFLFVSLLHLVVSLKSDCPHPCISLDKCPDLAKLIRTNVRVVQEATCSFEGLLPLVCCPESTTEHTTQSTPTPPPPVPNLLPKECGHFIHDSNNRIGKKTSLGNYPWMAALGYKNSLTNKNDFLCAGSLISERYVLTAAHCVISRTPDVIRLGEWDLSSEIDCEMMPSGIQFCVTEPAQDFSFEEIVTHPKYNTRAQFSDDIALIRLTTPVDLGPFIQPVCLPERDFDVRSSLGERRAVVTGWGFTENGTTTTTTYAAATSAILLQGFAPRVSRAECNVTYRGRVLEEQECFEGIAGKDSCVGDPGGPLMMTTPSAPPYTQIGILSYGPVSCGKETVPGVYTSVARYMDWVDQNMRP